MSEVRVRKSAEHLVLFVSAQRPWLQGVMQSFSVVPDLQAVPVELDAFLGGKIDKRLLDAIVLDVGDGAVLADERLYQVRGELARVPLVVVSDELPHDAMRQILRLGGSDWLKRPFEFRQLNDAVLGLVRGARAAEGRVYVTMSCVGGAGSTTLAIMLADSITGRGKDAANQCCLLDLDFAKGACGTYLDVQNDVDLGGVIEAPARLDAELLGQVRREYRDRFSVISFNQPSLPFAPTAEELVLRMTDAVTYQFRNTVIDLPSTWTPWRDRILELADGVILTTLLTIPAVREAQIVRSRIAGRAKAGQTLFVAINKDRRGLFGGGIGKTIGKTLGNSNLHFLPDDWETLSDAANRGLLPTEVNKRSSFAKKAQRMIDQFLRGGAAK
jgi:pilus assembly protein CpaE